MNVTPKINWTFQLSTQELKLVRRCLEKEGGNGAVLARKITDQINRARRDFVAAIDASMTIENEIQEMNHE